MKKILLCAMMAFLSIANIEAQKREAEICPDITSLAQSAGRQVHAELKARNVIRKVAPDEANQCVDEQDIVYQLNEDGESYMVYNGQKTTKKEVVIPSEVNGLPVTSIDEGAFYYNTYLTTITIPYGVTMIGHLAFYGCTSLTSITIPESVTSIGNQAFEGCSNLTSITIPNNVTNIGQYAFTGCSSLTSITIPNNVTNIGRYAFQDCSSLTSITIPASVTSIGDGAFFGCI